MRLRWQVEQRGARVNARPRRSLRLAPHDTLTKVGLTIEIIR